MGTVLAGPGADRRPVRGSARDRHRGQTGPGRRPRRPAQQLHGLADLRRHLLRTGPGPARPTRPTWTPGWTVRPGSGPTSTSRSTTTAGSGRPPPTTTTSCLRAYLLALRGRVPAELPAAQSATLASMLRVLVELSTDGGVLPVLHDGPYRRPQALQELLEVCVLGRQLVELPGLEQVEARHPRRAGSGCLPASRTSWSPGSPGPPRPAPLGWARRPRVGELRRRRAPRPALGRCPLAGRGRRRSARRRPRSPRQAGGLPLRRPRGLAAGAGSTAVRQRAAAASTTPGPLAHPTVRVDGQDQAETSGRLLLWQSRRGSTLAVTVGPGRLRGGLAPAPPADAGRVPPRRRARARRRGAGRRPGACDRPTTWTPHGQDGLFETTWRDGSTQVAADRGRDLHGCHASTVDTEFTWTPVRGPSDDPARVLGGIEWSSRSAETWFVSLYEPASDPTLPRPRLRIVSSTDLRHRGRGHASPAVEQPASTSPR